MPPVATVKGGYVPGRTRPTDRTRGQTTAMPAPVAAPWQSCPDHPLVGMETAAPGPGHAVSLPETPSETFITSATVVIDERAQCWGVDYAGKVVPPPGVFSEVSAGYAHSCGLRPRGAPYYVGAPAIPATTPSPSLQRLPDASHRRRRMLERLLPRPAHAASGRRFRIHQRREEL